MATQLSPGSLPPALTRVLPALACPVCGAPLAPATGPARSLVCPARHTFNVAHQGYASLLVPGPGQPVPRGDTAQMVQNRADFLGAGHYAPVRDAIVRQFQTTAPAPAPTPPPTDTADTSPAQPPARLALDLAGGTGYYLAGLLDAAPGLDGLVLDASVPAARRAAHAHARAAAATANAWGRLPLRGRSVAVALSVFGPRTPVELARVLAPSGLVITVTPLPQHMAEPRAALGLLGIQAAKTSELDRAFAAAGLGLADRHALRYRLRLTHLDVAREILMGPNAFHVQAPELLARVEKALPDLVDVTVAVEVSAFRTVRNRRNEPARAMA